MKKSLRLMKKISWWAKMHKSYARIIIVVSFIFLNALAFFTGYFLNQLGIFFSQASLFGFFFIFLLINSLNISSGLVACFQKFATKK